MIPRTLRPGRPGNRGFNRLRLAVSATLVLTHARLACLIDDISASGARLRVERDLGAGQPAQLMFHELLIQGTVVWSKQGECGLRFDQPLAGEDMQGMLWITENRELYERICEEDRVQVWADRD